MSNAPVTNPTTNKPVSKNDVNATTVVTSAAPKPSTAKSPTRSTVNIVRAIPINNTAAHKRHIWLNKNYQILELNFR